MSEYIDNVSKRERQLKAIILQLHEGKDPEQVKTAFAEMLADVGPDEVVRIEEALVAEGLDPTQIQPLCDLHVALFREALDSRPAPEAVPGHPVFTFRAENLGVVRVLEQLKRALEEISRHPTTETIREAREILDKLQIYDRHYVRKENLLFPYLEHTGFAGPSKVMWGIHNEIRALWKELRRILNESPAPVNLNRALEVFTTLDHTIREMIYKEERILFPAALERLTEEDWSAIRAQEDEIGFAYALPGRSWRGTDDAREAQEGHPQNAPATGSREAENALIALEVGALTVEQIDMMLKTLPVDITFVDEEDRVRYFSQTAERIFPRSPAIIGRKVQNCHPPQSVDKVQAILDDFRAGKRDVAEFWIQFAPSRQEQKSASEGQFIHIRYFALRDSSGTYRGTLEVTQNLTHLRKLKGERRLLDD